MPAHLRPGISKQFQSDWMTQQGAAELAKMIEEFWAKQGIKVTTRLEHHTTIPGVNNFYCVRSDIKLVSK